MEKEILKSIRRYRKLTFTLSAIGIALAYYSVYVSTAKTNDPDYRALCDISESMRCSNVFTSPFGKGLGIVGKIAGENSPLYQSNGVYGMLSYASFIILSFLPYTFFARIQVLLGILGNIVSMYLAYILFFILGDICVVCITTYVIGFLLLIVSMFNLSAVKRLRSASNVQNYSTYLDGRSSGKKRV